MANPTADSSGSPLDVPTIDAGAVTLRSFHMNDLDLVAEVAGDPLIPKITTVPSDYSPTAGEAFIERQWDRATTGYGYSFTIARSDGDRAVGQIGLWLPNRQEGRASIGYWIGQTHRRQGYAAAALAALSPWAFGAHPDLHRLELFIEPWNIGSLRTAEGAGFEVEGLLRQWQQVDGEWRDMHVLSRLRQPA